MDKFFEFLNSDTLLYGVILGAILIGIYWFMSQFATPFSHYSVIYDPDGSGKTIQSNFISYELVKISKGGDKYIRNYHFIDEDKNIIIVPEERVVNVESIYDEEEEDE